jgi:hypothetical protein
MGGLHLSASLLARTQRRFDFRLLNASVLFLLAMVAYTLYEQPDTAPLRPLLRTLGLQMLLPAVTAIGLDIAQHVCIRQQCARPRPAFRAEPPSLLPSLEHLKEAVWQAQVGGADSADARSGV